MNEPKDPHFMLSDGSYCHVLEDRLYIGKKEIPGTFPPQKHGMDIVTFGLQLAALLLLGFFITMTVIVHYYMVTFMLSLLLLLLGVSLVRTFGYTNTMVIMKADVVGVKYLHRSVGYDLFIVSYSGKNGNLRKRRLMIYDSKETSTKAIAVMKEAGLLK
jgi:hypothetical protein